LVYDTNHIGITLNFSSAHYQQDKSQIKNLKSLELFCQMTFATVSKCFPLKRGQKKSGQSRTFQK
jgi:hypothetical protein